MTKKRAPVATTQSMLIELQAIVTDSHASAEMKVHAVALAYELGLNQGTLDGSIAMAERLTKPTTPT